MTRRQPFSSVGTRPTVVENSPSAFAPLLYLLYLVPLFSSSSVSDLFRSETALSYLGFHGHSCANKRGRSRLIRLFAHPLRPQKHNSPRGAAGPQRVVRFTPHDSSTRHRRRLQVSRGDSPFNRARRYLSSEGKVKAKAGGGQGPRRGAGGHGGEDATESAKEGARVQRGGAAASIDSDVTFRIRVPPGCSAFPLPQSAFPLSREPSPARGPLRGRGRLRATSQ
jgi:hypothetical protein